jgi:hypothetical protein
MITIENLRQKNFTPEEFLHSNTAAASLRDDNPLNDIKNEPGQQELENGVKLASKMQEIRDALKKSIIITSGFRCPALNKAVGGAPGSWHMKFLAIDFCIPGMEPHEVVLELKKTGVSVDKVFVERKCTHMQTCLDDNDNRNFFGTAVKIDGKWVVSDQIKKV